MPDRSPRRIQLRRTQGPAERPDIHSKTRTGGDGPSYCVRVGVSVQYAWDWGSVEVSPLVVGQDWHEQIMRFMELLELPVPVGKEPGWHLNCSYG